ncbi:MAG: S9 family peptidase [Gemmatimonadota bacterium]|nr:MAG: S9 family peptidase [Gemmatimonadota bacterium]
MRPLQSLRISCAMFLVSTPINPGVHAQVPEPVIEETQFELSVANIMRGPELVGTTPSQIRWSPDGRTLYFVWKPPYEERQGLYRVSRGGGQPERLSDEEAARLEPRLHAVYSEDRDEAAYEHDGALFYLDVGSGRQRLLVSAPDRLSHIQMSPDGETVYFVRGDNLFKVDLESGAVTQLTDIRRGRGSPEREPPAGQRLHLSEQQRELLRVFAEDSISRARRWPPPPDTAQVDTPQAFYVRNGQRLGGYWVAPDGARMAFDLSDEARDARLAWVPDYVTEDGYTREAPRMRTFVGDEQGTGKLGIMDLLTGDVTWVEHAQQDRQVDLSFRGWSNGSDRLLAVGISDDFKDRWILRVDAATGESTALDHLHDDAWIGGPGWNSAGWMPDGDHVWYISEATGFAHLYTIAEGGGEPTPLTTGPWEVVRVELSPDEKEWFLVTSEVSPHERGFYRMNLDGGNRRLITGFRTLQGSEGRGRGRGGARSGSVAVSPDGRRLAVMYAWPNHPPELFLQDNRAGAEPVQVTRSTTPEFDSFAWHAPEIVYFPAQDGEDVPARVYRPTEPNGVGVIFVHGAGYVQNVHNWWSSYYREFMFHNLLVERGYTVLDIDYRGSAGYGRDWRTAIHKHMGETDLSDQVDGARFLINELGVEAGRIGIYGGSYGGFITLMAMFTEPEMFAAGAALRPVTDWAYYSHRYTAPILGLPQDDAEAYARSSPIYHAEGLQGALLICHGMIDQNVHFQDTVRLAERLMELGKESWEVAIYPKEDHGFVHSWAWTDQYRRILKLFEENLR